MHDHQRVSRSPVTKLLKEFIENVVVALHESVGFRNQILEQPHPLQARDEFVCISSAMPSELTEFLILRVLSNEVRTLQCLITYALNDGLHGFNIPQFCLGEKGIHLSHLRKESANGVVTSRLVDNYLINID